MNSVVLMAAALAVAAPALKDKPKPVTDVTGAWQVVRSVVSGRAGTVGADLVYEFTKDGKWQIRRDGEALSPTLDRGFDADPKADPPTIDLINNRAAATGSRLRGIYKIDGDTLTICGTRTATADRPKAFESEAGSGLTLYVLKRVKKE